MRSKSMATPRFLGLTELSTLAKLFEFRSVSRWVGLGLITGVASGLSAVALFAAISGVQHVVLHLLANFEPLGPLGEIALFESETQGPPRRWVLVLAPAVGGLVAGWVVHRFGGGLRGHGTDVVIEAFHTGRGLVKTQPVVKGFMSAILIGTGGSAGREGPIALIGAGLGSALGKALNLSARERRMLLLAGAAGGIGAIFQSPFGAALFVLEVLYRDDFEVEAIVPTVLSSVVGYSVFTMIFGRGTIFLVEKGQDFTPQQLPFYLLMAVFSALVGLTFIKVFKTTSAAFEKLSIRPYARPMLGGLAVGVMSLGVPQALGAGYGWLQQALLPSSEHLAGGWMGALTLLGIALAKVLTTSLSVGSGGPGGVFGPTVVIGGMVGGACGLAFHELVPNIVTEPGAFVLVGMACFLGGVLKAPISTLVLASELTGSHGLLVPLMLAEVVTYALSSRFSLYPGQVPTRRDSPAHEAEYIFDVLNDERVCDVYDEHAIVVPVAPSAPVTELLKRAAESEHAVFPVVGADGAIHGVVTLETLRAAFVDEDLQRFAIAEDCAAPFVSITPSDTLRTALERFATSHSPALLVMGEGDPSTIRGLLSYEALLGAYRDALDARRRTAGQEGPGPSVSPD